MKKIILSLVSILFFSAIVWGQATAEIAGTVRDESGAVIPGAEIKVTQTATGASRTTISNEEGRYIFSTLPLGHMYLKLLARGSPHLSSPASRVSTLAWASEARLDIFSKASRTS